MIVIIAWIMSNRSKPCDDDREYYIYHFKWNGLILQNMKENKKYCGKDCHFTRISFYRPQRSWGKVMFLQVCVILFTGGILDQIHPPRTRYTPWDQVHPPGPGTPPRPGTTLPGPGTPPQDQVHPPGPGTPPSAEHAGRYGQRVGGTHPTGMQSC